MERFRKHLLKLKLKLSFELWYKIFLKCSIVAMILSILYLIFSKWTYLCDSTLFFTTLILLTVLVSLLFTFFQRITWQKTAQTADKLGYEERFITALELLEQNKSYSKIETMVIEDALQKAQEDIAKKYLLTVPKKELKLIVLLFAIKNLF